MGCLGNGFNCQNNPTVKSLNAELANYKTWSAMLQNAVNRLKKWTIDWEAEGLIAEKILPQSKLMETDKFQELWKSTFGWLPFDNSNGHSAYNLGYSTHRIPMDTIKKILTLSQIDKTKYVNYAPSLGTGFMCQDFSFAFTSLINNSPLWFAYIGSCGGHRHTPTGGDVVNTSHHINFVVPVEDPPTIWFIEPQSDGIWKPDYKTKVNEFFPMTVLW
jgi:hypothetical protein